MLVRANHVFADPDPAVDSPAIPRLSDTNPRVSNTPPPESLPEPPPESEPEPTPKPPPPVGPPRPATADGAATSPP